MTAKAFTPTRIEGGILLGTRAAVAAFTNRHESVVRRHCQPIACDWRTRALLFDLDAAEAALGTARRVA